MSKIVICEQCGRERPHGAHGLCKSCYMRQWRHSNREHVREYKRKYNARHPEPNRNRVKRWRKANPERHRERNRRYYYANLEKERERCRRYRQANPEKRREACRNWRLNNPDKARELRERYRARKLGAAVSPVNEAAIYERDGYMCMYCGRTDNLELDHVVPLSRGGAHCEDNLVVACGYCNPSKGARPLEDWLQTQPYSIAWLF